MEIWHIWVIIALIFFLIEIFTSGFAVACFSIGALTSAIGAACNIHIIWQIIIFAVFSVVSLIFVRPLVIKFFFKSGKGRRTNADALIGKKGKVTQDIDSATGYGRVAIDGDDWKAVSIDGQNIPKGSDVEVVKIESIILTVKTI